MDPAPTQSTKIIPLILSLFFHLTAMSALACMSAFSTKLLLSTSSAGAGFAAGVVFYLTALAFASLSEQ